MRILLSVSILGQNYRRQELKLAKSQLGSQADLQGQNIIQRTILSNNEYWLKTLTTAEQVSIQNIHDSEFKLCKNVFGVGRYRGGSIEEDIDADSSTNVTIAIRNAQLAWYKASPWRLQQCIWKLQF